MPNSEYVRHKRDIKFYKFYSEHWQQCRAPVLNIKSILVTKLDTCANLVIRQENDIASGPKFKKKLKGRLLFPTLKIIQYTSSL
jgi:hypothetical protein